MKVLFFWASYCGSCKFMQREILPKVYEAGVDIQEINCMRDVAEAKKWKITRLPYIIVLNDSNEIFWERGGVVAAELLISLAEKPEQA